MPAVLISFVLSMLSEGIYCRVATISSLGKSIHFEGASLLLYTFLALLIINATKELTPAKSHREFEKKQSINHAGAVFDLQQQKSSLRMSCRALVLATVWKERMSAPSTQLITAVIV